MVDAYEEEADEAGVEPRARRRPLAPHRGGTVLTLGILGLVVCFICGIIAWVMGNEDLRAMRDGRMDRSGEGMTSAGRVCGMISVILAAVGVTIFVLVAVLAGASGRYD